MKVISRERVFERLNWLVGLLNLLGYRDRNVRFLWPPGWLLGQIDECVRFLIELDRKKPPILRWKTFKTLDKRRRSLRLVPRINSLVKRAVERRKEKCSESVLEKAVRRPDSLETQILLRDWSKRGQSRSVAGFLLRLGRNYGSRIIKSRDHTDRD